MDFMNLHNNSFLRYYVSDMVLHVDRDAAYLVCPKACSCVAGIIIYTFTLKSQNINILMLEYYMSVKHYGT